MPFGADAAQDERRAAGGPFPGADGGAAHGEGMTGRTSRIVIGLAGLWALFGAFGVALHEKARTVDDKGMGFVSVAGFDGEVYMRRYCDVYSIFRIRKRHPAEAIVAAPAYVVGSAVASRAGQEPAKVAQILLFAAVAAVTAGLLWLLTEDLGAMALWLSFGSVWLLASAPELFAVSQLILVGTLLLVKRNVRDLRAWLALTLLAGGTTITNVVKPVAAWCTGVLRDRSARAALRHHAGKIGLGLAVLFVALAFAEVAKWIWIDGRSVQSEVAMGWDYIAKWSASGYGFGERLARLWEMFWCEPLMSHGAIFGQANADGLDVLPLGYRWPLPHAAGAALLALCGWSAWRNRADAVVRAALAMVAFDVVLHVLIGWGLPEAQIYCGHWFFVVPLLVAKLRGQAWKLALAAGLFAWNVWMIGGELL